LKFFEPPYFYDSLPNPLSLRLLYGCKQKANWRCQKLSEPILEDQKEVLDQFNGPKKPKNRRKRRFLGYQILCDLLSYFTPY